ncbi:hypothetical protein J8Z86_09130 [Yersinia enterocolitica]|uniref:hypothetical protein n=1 Tax=Yersinia enterocolitica TaxID=630 RepID=UPI001C8E589F|nr:hypothetical protein [Yersinia enterocolitica]MBX9496228.1 hypothetical protein [Yersinia enterocolitica]
MLSETRGGGGSGLGGLLSTLEDTIVLSGTRDGGAGGGTLGRGITFLLVLFGVFWDRTASISILLIGCSE